MATVDRVHYDRVNWTLENYDTENLGEAIVDQINRILLKYYGTTAVSNEPGQELPQNFELQQNYPNPFNPGTTISYLTPRQSRVRLEVFDLLGRKVAILVDERVEAGYHQVRFDASTLASGVYIYRLEAGSDVLLKKMTVIK